MTKFQWPRRSRQSTRLRHRQSLAYRRFILMEALENRRLLAADDVCLANPSGLIADAGSMPSGQLAANPPAAEGTVSPVSRNSSETVGSQPPAFEIAASEEFAFAMQAAASTANSGVADVDYQRGQWLSEGPIGTNSSILQGLSPSSSIAGATHTVVAHPTDADILYVGTVNGGIWKTSNATDRLPIWEAQTDDLPSLSIGAMAFDPTDVTNQSLVAVTGDHSSFGRLSGSTGSVYTTTDGGQTWNDPGSANLADERLAGVAVRGNTIVVSSEGFGGGIFRSTDAGANFVAINSADFAEFDNFSDLVEDPNDVNRLYTANPGNNGGGGPGGIYRSDDFGVNWVKLTGPAIDTELNDLLVTSNNIEMAVAPTTGRLYAAILVQGVPEAVYYSDTATTANPTWTRMDVPRLPQGDPVPVFGASNASPIVINSPGHGITDANQFVVIDGVTGNTAANGFHRVSVIDANNFQLLGTAGNGAYTGGGTWTPVAAPNPKPKPNDEAGGQGALHFSITADPTDANLVYLGGDRQDAPSLIGSINNSGAIFRGDTRLPRAPSLATSPQWDHITNNPADFDPDAGTASNSAPHADSREMTFDAAGNLIEVDDGGVYKRTNPRDNTGDWFSLVGNLAATEIHNVAYDSVSNTATAGLQDNGTLYQPAAGATFWNALSAGDGGDIVVDDVSLAALGQSIRYTSFQNLGAFRRTTWDASGRLINTEFPALTVTSGAAFQPVFTTPVAGNNVDPQRLLFGMANGVYQSNNQGDTISAVGAGISPTNSTVGNAMDFGGRSGGVANPDVAYVGSSDGNVHVRTDTGAFVVTDPTAGTSSIRDVVMDPDEWRTAFAIDFDQVFTTTDTGGAWNDITGNLAALGATGFRALEYVTGVTDALLIGTNLGVFSTLLTSLGTWTRLGTDLPNALVFDLDYDATDDVLIAGTMGRGVWSLDGVSRVINPVTGSTNVTLDASSNLVITDQTGNLDDLITIQSDTTNSRFVVSGTGQTINTSIAGASGDGTDTVLVPFTSVPGNTVRVETLAGQDSVVLDLALGNFDKEVVVQGNAANSGQGDQLSLRGGGTFATLDFVATSDSAGTIAIPGNSTISYQGLAAVHSDLESQAVTLSYSNDPESLFISPSGDENKAVHVGSSVAANLSFQLPTASLDIDSGSVGSDILEMIGGFDFGIADFNLLSDEVTLSGAGLFTAGAGAIAITGDRNVSLNDNSRLNTVDGNITVNGNQTATPAAGDFNGITLSGAMVTSVNGDILLVGRGGDEVGGLFNSGIRTFGESRIESLGTGPDAGTIELVGRGGDLGSVSRGIQLGGGSTTISSIDGDIQLLGTGGDGPGANNQGLITFDDVLIESTGTTGDAAAITINGVAGQGTGGDVGVYLNNGGVVIESVAGDIDIVGTGNGTGNFSIGVRVDSAIVQSTGTGALAADVAVQGTSASGVDANRGIQFTGTGTIATVDGDATVTGIAGAATGSFNEGIRFFGGQIRSTGSGDLLVTGIGTGAGSEGIEQRDSAVIEATATGDVRLIATAQDAGTNGYFLDTARLGSPTGTGQVEVIADRVSIDTANAVEGTGRLVFAPETAATSIGISGGAGTLNLNDTELSRIATTFDEVVIGDATSGTGDVEVQSLDFATDLSIVGGNIDIDGINLLTNDLNLTARTGQITDTAASPDITASSATFAGNLAPGQSPGILDITGDFNLAANGVLALEFGGPIPGDAADNRDQVRTSGTVTISPGATLTATAIGGFTASDGDEFVIIDNGSTSAVVGQFDNSRLTNVFGNGLDGVITYDGGDGNDVVLTILPPAVAIAVAPTEVDEDGTENIVFTLSRNSAAGALTVDFNVLGSAVFGDDYSQTGADSFDASSGSATFADGALTTTLTIDPTVDSVVESDEDVTLTLIDGAAYDLATESAATGTINNDDTAVVTLTALSATNLEGTDGTTTAFTFQASVDVGVQGGFSVGYVTDDVSATVADGDYVDNDGFLDFDGSPGQDQVITVLVNHDGEVEPDETFAVVLGAITNLSPGIDATDVTVTNGTQTGLIQNDDFDAIVDSIGNLLIDDSDGSQDDRLTIVLEGDNYRVSDPNNPITAGAGTIQDGPNSILVPIANVTGSIIVTTRGGDDTLSVDRSGGVLPNAIDYSGGLGGNDTLNVLGGTATTLTFDYVNESDGSIQVDSEPAIVYSGLEPITSTITATHVVFNFSGVDETITLADDGIVGNNISQIDSTAGESTTFVNPTNSLTINAGDGADLIDVDALDDQYAASMILIGGDGDDTLDVDGLVIANAPGRGLEIAGVETATLDSVTLTGNTATRGAGLLVSGPSNVTVSDSLIRTNFATGDLITDGGGGIFSDNADLTIQRTTIEDNLALGLLGNGGGIFVQGGTLTASDNTIININGAIRAGGGIENSGGTVNLTDVSLTNNVAFINGGGLHASGSSVTSISGGLIQSNSADQEGGGLWNGPGDMTVTGTTIDQNIANSAAAATDAQGGGGIFNIGGNLTIGSGTTITANSAADPDAGGTNDDGGGGIFNDGGTVSLSGNNIQITGNLATDGLGNGGGILTLGGIVTATDVTVSGNAAARAGGGIENNGGSVVLTDLVVIGNSASINGGGVHAAGTNNITAVVGGLYASNIADQEGGGLWVGSGVMSINGASVLTNIASSSSNADNDQGGGGVFGINSVLDLDDAIIADNSADTNLGNGGGVMTVGGIVTIDGGRITGNSAARAGGGIENNAGNVTLTDANVGDFFNGGGNTAGVNGGGLHASGATSVTEVIRGLFDDNVADQEGGGLWNGSGQMTITDTQIIFNIANASANANGDQGGGGVFNIGGDLTLTGANIFANSTPSAMAPGGGILSDGGTINVAGSTIQSNAVYGVSLINGASGSLRTNTMLGNVLADVDIVGNASDNSFTVTSQNVTVDGASVDIDGGIEILQVRGMDGADTFDVTSGGSTNFLIDGGDPATLPGDVLNFDATAQSVTSEPTTVQAGADLAVGFSNIERINLTNTDGVLLINGTNLDDELEVNATSSDSGTYQLTSDGVAGPIIGFTGVTSLTFNGNDGDDELLVSNPVGGLFNPVDGIFFNGGNQASGTDGDQLVILGGMADTVEHVFQNANDGQVFYDAAATASITYTGLEPILDVVTATNRLFTFTGGAETITLGDDGDAGDGESLIDSTLGESVVFTNPTATLTVNAGSDDDVIEVTALDSTYAASTILDGGDDTDQINITGATFDTAGAGRGLQIAGSETSTIVDTLIANNSLADNGAGLFIAAGDVTIRNSTITNNSSVGFNGGGVIVAPGATLTLDGTTVSDNSAERAGGIGSDGDLTILNGSLISGNTSVLDTAGIGVGSGLLSIDASTISGNVAGTDGGGINTRAASTTITGGTVISGNIAGGATGSGGGIFHQQGSLTISDSTISGNIANRAGGGIEDVSGSGTTVALTNVTLTGNSAGVDLDSPTFGFDPVAAPGNGGGLHVTGDGTVTVTGGTITGNLAASEGGGLWNGSGTMSVDSAMLSGNTASGTGDDQGGGAIFNAGGSLIVQNATQITGNTATTGGAGGGILSDGGTINVTGTTLSGNDRYGISLVGGANGTITGNVFTGNVQAAVSIQADASNNDVTINPTSVDIDTVVTTYDASVPTLEVFGGDGSDTFSVTPGPDTAYLLDGGDPTTLPGDVLNFDAGGQSVTMQGNTLQAGADLPTTHDRFETVNLNNTDGTLSIIGSALDDVLEITATSSDSGTYQLTSDGIAGPVFGFTGLTSLSFAGTDGNDILRINNPAGGLFAPSGGINYDGGGETAGGLGDSLEVLGGTANSVEHVFVNESDGSLFYNGGTDAVIVYSDLEPVLDTITATTRTFTFTGGDESISLGDDAVPANNQSLIDSTLGESVIFVNPTNVLTVQSGTGIDTISVTTLDANYAASLVIDGGETANDTLTMTDVDMVNTPGRGLTLSELETITITGGTISGNTATNGAGVLINNSSTATTTATMSGVTVSGNTATAGAGATDGGGGIYNSGAVLTINGGSTISGNTAVAGISSGGGILSTGTLTVANSTISGNSANRAGGGIEITDGSGVTTLSGITLSDNQALGGGGPGNGGGLHITGPGNSVITGGSVTGNLADQEGGGLWNGTGTMQVNGVLIDNNTANSADNAGNDQGGGGVFNAGGVVDIDNATITNNIATAGNGNGGGVMTDGGAILINGGSIGGNTATRAGGGVENNAGTVNLFQVTVSGNSTSINGGGIHASGGASVTTVRESTVSDNSAGQEGGGLWNGPGMMTIDLTTINNNTASSGNNAGNDQGGGGVFNIGGTLEIDDATIRDNIATAGNGNGGGVMTVGGTVTIDGGSIANNQAARAGGGVENNAGNVTLSAVSVTNNTADVNGGGLHASGAASVTTVTDGLFQLNVAGQEGGGLWVADGLLTINGTTIDQNTASSGNNADDDQGGGGVFNINGTLDIDDAIITNNIATANNGNGGGVMSVGGVTTIDGGQISGNQAARAGGGIENNAGNVSVTSVDVLNNNAEINGGGLHASGAASVTTVTDGAFRSNTAGQEGGGLWNGPGDMTINGTTIDQNTANSAANTNDDQGGGGVFNIGGSVDIDNATITGNVADLNNGNGGGVMTVGGTVTIDGGSISGNSAARAGGGIENNAGTVSMTNVTVTSNTAGVNGGGLHASGAASVSTVTGGLFQLNSAGQEGGGLWVADGLLTINGTTIDQNTASSGNNAGNDQGGGGVFNIGGVVDIDNATITANVATANNGNGGGVMTVGGTVTIDGGSISGNSAGRAGGGIENNDGNVSLTTVAVTGNTATVNGGGLHAAGASSVTTVTTNSTFSGNVAGQEGGGLWNGAGMMTIAGSAINQNTAQSADNAANDQGGGGVFNIGGTLDIDSSTITLNVATDNSGNGGGVMTVGGIVTIDDSTIADNSAARAGGGVENNAGNVRLTNVDVLRNNAGVNGGGLHASEATSVTAVVGGLFQANQANQEGGGLWNGPGSMSINGTTIDANIASAGVNALLDQGGGGVFNIDGDLDVDDVTFTNNLATSNLGNGGGLMTVGGTVTVDGGSMTGNRAERAGGAIENNSGTVTTTNVTVGGPTVNDGNVAGINGGGLHAAGTASVTTVNGGLFQNNLASEEGGGLWLGDGSLTIIDTTIDENAVGSGNNVADDQGGGGVFNIGGTLDIDNATITGNVADLNNGNGGGVMAVGGTTTIDGGEISGNSAGRAGGGIENNAGDVSVTGVNVLNNTATINGGGLHASDAASVTTVTDGLFQLNTADQEGGGLWVADGLLTINGTTIDQNTASSGNNAGNDQGGGGVFNIGGTLDIDNADITANVATDNNGNGGGVMAVGGTTTIDGGEISGNSAARAGGGIENNAGTVSVTSVNVLNNNAGINGGGLHASGAASVTVVTDGLFQLNTAGEEGGGLWVGAGSLTISGTTIDQNTASSGSNAGNDQGGGGVFNIGGTLDIDNATITANVATDNNGNGGGVMAVGGTTTIDGGEISGNTAARAGGGIENNDGNVSVTGVNVLSNQAGINGGGLHASGASSVTTVTDGLFQLNTAGQEGGGLWVADGQLTINGTTIDQNTASSSANTNNDQGGGGVFNIGGTLDIDNATITANLATANNGNGGGVMAVGGKTTIDGGEISGNQAARAGGGIENNAGDVSVTGVSVLNNSAVINGGGLHASDAASMTTVTNGLFQLNTAGEEGGGLWVADGLLTINGTTIDQNTASSGNNASNDQGGGGVFNIGGTLDIDNAAITANVATDNNGNGGGVMVVGGTTTIDGGEISGNSAMRAGGGIENSTGTITVTDVDVLRNSTGINGGGLHAAGATSVTTVTDGLFQLNTAGQEGGGLWVADGLLRINGTTIDQNVARSGNNTADDQGGGGVFNIGGTLDIDNAAITANVATDNNGNGGGVMVVGGTTTIDGGEISGNSAMRAGGGIENNAGTITVTDVNVLSNSTDVNGGGLHAAGATSNTTVNGGLFQLNTANQEGGGLWVADGLLKIDGTSIDQNTASSGANAGNDQGGGGVFNINGTLDIDNAMITANIATANDGSGGGVMSVGGTTMIDGGTISSNSAGRDGGGIQNLAGDLDITAVNVNSNTAGRNGGGLYTIGAPMEVTVTGGKFELNIASGTGAQDGGGGMYIQTGTLDVTNVLIDNNSANTGGGSGGGIFSNDATLNVRDSTIIRNDLCGIAFVIARGQLFDNAFGVGTVDANVGGALCPLIGTDNADQVTVTTRVEDGRILTNININGAELDYDAGVGPVSLTPGLGDDVVDIRGTVATNPINVITGEGNDVVNVASDAPGLAGNLDEILGEVSISGEGNLADLAGTEITAKGTTIGAGLVLGDTVNISDNASGLDNSYRLSGTRFIRDGANPTAAINFESIESLNITTGVGSDTLAIESTAAQTSVSVDTNVGSDTVTIDDSGDAGVLRLDTNSGDDTVTIDGGGNQAAMQIRTGIGNDQIDVQSTGSLAALLAIAGLGNDVFAITGVSAMTGTELFGDELVASAADGEDTFDFGRTLAQLSNDTLGTLAGVLGEICVDGGDGALTQASRTESARKAPGATSNLILNQSNAQSDSIFLSDAGSPNAAGNTYVVNPTTLSRNGASRTNITYERIESVTIRAGQFDDVVDINDTVAGTELTVFAGGGDDIINVNDSGAGTFTGIQTGLIGGLGTTDEDTVNVQTTGDGSFVAIDTRVVIPPVAAAAGIADQDTVNVIGRGTGTGITIQTGVDSDTINIGDGNFATGALTGSPSLIQVQSGDDGDTINVREVFAETVVDLSGDAGNDTFELFADGADARGDLGRLNDVPGVANSPLSSADTRELLIDGGSNASQTRTVVDGAVVVDNQLLSPRPTQSTDVGDEINIDASSASVGLDLRFVVTAAGQGVLGTTTPTDSQANRETVMNEVFDSLNIENVNLTTGSGEDVLTVSSNVPLGIAQTDQVVRFDGGTSDDRLEVLGGNNDDVITVGDNDSTNPAQTVEPFEITNVSFLRIDGLAGDDRIVNNTGTVLAADDNVATSAQVISVLNGGEGGDTLLGGSQGDALTGGADIDFLFGRGGNDILLSEQDFGSDVRLPVSGEILDGGDEDDSPGDLCIQVGQDTVRNCEVLGDGGAEKDVLTWLRASLIPIGSVSFGADAVQFDPFDPIAEVGIAGLTTREPSSLSPAATSGNGSPAAATGSGLSTTQTGEGEDRMDVNRDGRVSSLDALQVINQVSRLNQQAAGELQVSAQSSTDGELESTDVNADGLVTALDALLIINSISRSATFSSGLVSGEQVSAVDQSSTRSNEEQTPRSIPEATDAIFDFGQSGDSDQIEDSWARVVDEVYAADRQLDDDDDLDWALDHLLD